MERDLQILGVDFSGAAPDNNTWVAQGSLGARGLVLGQCRPVSRAELADELAALPGGSVAALDFPFSVPVQFARYWRPEAVSMTQLWDAAAGMELPQFIQLRDDFVAHHGEPKRVIDLSHPEAYSCLHKVNPNMVPMTFRGMQMLARLWPAGCDVPPLPPQEASKGVLLEVMPGAVLRALGLPFKGYKNGARRLELRQSILEELPRRSSVPVPNLKQFRDQCLASHDCLDAIVAALAAALWATDPSLFRSPSDADAGGLDPPSPTTLRIEGWLYAPTRTGDGASKNQTG